MPLFYEKNEPILEETDIKNETHIYKYKKIKDSRDIDKFLKYSREILNDENNMNKETIRNQIKVIYFRNKFIGYIGLVSYVSDKTNKKYLAIRSFMILPQYQGMGHGTNIINNIIEENKTKGYDEIYCWVEKDNINAIKFYQRIADVNNNLFKDKYYYVCLYKKSNINESYIGGSNSGNYPYYHLAKSGNIKTLEPRIPDNFMTKHGYENSTTKRVCFTPTIDKCLMAISKGIYEEEYFVYVMDGDYGVYRPTLSEVPDVKITGEVWIKEPVKVKCIGKIKVITDDGKPGKKFKYGNNEEAELFGWNYKWIEKTKQLNEFVSSINEESKIEDDKLPKYIYHISYINHDGETFEPRTYENDNVKNGMERKVKRVCFSDSITRALYSIFPNGAFDADFYVHIPGSDVKVYNTDTNDIYDSDITHELWVKEPVVMKCIGKIHVSGVSKKTHTIEVDKDKAGYGKKKYHESNWKWIEKYKDDATLYESCTKESSDIRDSKRESVLNTVEETLKKLGKNPKISKSDREKWINHKQQMFGDSLCIAGLGHDGLSSLCTKVNKEIKPLEGRLSPDNYGTAFLSVKESSINEEAEYDKKNKYPVYIVAMHSGTPLANIIQKVTNDEFSHACISFNSKLDPLYSFGSKKFGEKSLGLVKQNPYVEFYKNYKAHYKVFVTFVDKSSYERMKEKIKWFEENDEKMKYDFIGLIKILFNKDTEKNTYKYFCSRFVSEILGYGKELSKLPSLYKPQDLVELDFVSLVNGGDDFFKYNFRITEKNLKNVKKHVFDKVVFGESKLPDQIYSAFHLEPEYKDPKYCCWDEELYYRNLQSAVIALHSSRNKEGEYEVYTDLGCGKTKYIGQITYYHNPDTNEPSYVWNKTINEMIYLLGENAANTVIVGTAGNVFIHNCMKKNTFTDTPEDNEYIVSRDGGTDIFRFGEDGKKYKLTREEFTNDYTVLNTYKFRQPLLNSMDYFKTVLESKSGYDFYLHLIYNNTPQKDISRDARFEESTSLFQEIDQIKQKIFCEYYQIRNNKSVIDWVDGKIQSLLEVSYRPDSEKSVNESNSRYDSYYVERMIDRLKTLQTCLPTIN